MTAPVIIDTSRLTAAQLAALARLLLGLAALAVDALAAGLAARRLVGAEALLRHLAVDERVGEAGHVARGLPHARMHEDGRVEPLDIVAIRHCLPPGLLHVAQQLDAERTVIPAAI